MEESVKKTEIKKVAKLVLVWLVVVNLFALIGLNRFNLKGDNAYKWIPVERYTQQQTWNIADLHSRWDSNWYLSVAREGYFRSENDTFSNVIFFPLYPLLIRVFAEPLGGDQILAGWLVSCVCLVFAAIYLFKLAKKFHKDVDPSLAVVLLLSFPTAFFLNAVYTESLFLLLSVAAFFYVKSGNYKVAALFGFLASLTRITGVLLFIPLLIELVKNEGKSKQALVRSFPLLAIPLGTATFFLYHWKRFGDFLLFFRVESVWGRSFSPNLEHFILDNRSAISNFSLDLFYLLFILAVIVVLARRRQFAYFFYVASTALVAISTGTLMSIGRYILVLFPIYLVGAGIKSQNLRYLWLIVSLLLFALNTILFVNWYWAG